MSLPFGITTKPSVSKTHAALVSIDDHLGKSDVMIQTWWNGEGFTLTIGEGAKSQMIDISHVQWTATKMAVRAIKNAESEEPTC